jgi:hypothetical protein
MHNRISLIQHQCSGTGAGLSNISDYQTAHVLISVFTGNFLLTAAVLGLSK